MIPVGDVLSAFHVCIQIVARKTRSCLFMGSREYHIADFSETLFPLAVSKQIISDTNSVSEHTHDFIELVYVLQGAGTNLIDQHPYPILRGDLYIINRGSTHAFTVSRHLVFLNMMFRFSLIPRQVRKEFESFSAYRELFEISPAVRHKINLFPA